MKALSPSNVSRGTPMNSIIAKIGNLAHGSGSNLFLSLHHFLIAAAIEGLLNCWELKTLDE
jgi:hypothetical protein